MWSLSVLLQIISQVQNIVAVVALWLVVGNLVFAFNQQKDKETKWKHLTFYYYREKQARVLITAIGTNYHFSMLVDVIDFIGTH